jgi:GT2 family glycosyltransferase
MTQSAANNIGAVAIGRNEGQRLERCLWSLVGRCACVVYVDSGSTDGSVELATGLGAHVVNLDPSVPFTAARARNEGAAKLLAVAPQTQFIQFVDGDCEMAESWLETATTALHDNPAWAVVCGRRRERHPEASVYNLLCDIEWNTPVGEALACGGDALIRTEAFQQVGGFNPSVVAGEEPEMCVRIRQHGWKIVRLDAEMTLHDAAMTRFGQWWKRNVRAGHAYAEGNAMHGAPPERHWAREVRSNWFWGAIMPIVMLALAWPTWGISLILLAGYAVLYLRVRRNAIARGIDPRHASAYARFVVLGKFPQALGQLKYTLGRMTGRRSRIIEYKGAQDPSAAGGAIRREVSRT